MDGHIESRRSLLRKAGVGAAVVWSAPVVAAVVAPTAAHAQSACTCDLTLVVPVRPLNDGVEFSVTVATTCPGATRVRYILAGRAPVASNGLVITETLSIAEINAFQDSVPLTVEVYGAGPDALTECTTNLTFSG